MGRHKIVLLIALLSLIVGIAQADVIIKQKSTMNGMGFMDADVNSTEYVKADRSATESITNMKGAMAMLGGKDTKSTQVVRLDKGVMWNINTDDKSYTETSLTFLKDELANATDEGEVDEVEEEDEYTWTVEVKTEDKPVDINGYKCKGIIAIAKGVKKTDPTDKKDLCIEYWLAKDVAAYDELMQFQKKYAEITGIDIADAQAAGAQMVGGYGEMFGQLYDKMKDAEGYPIKTVMTMKSSVPPEEKAEASDENAEEEETSEEDIDNSNIPSGLKGMMKGMIKQQKEAKATDAEGMKTMMTITTEIQSIEQKPADAAKFEVPAGFALK